MKSIMLTTAEVREIRCKPSVGLCSMQMNRREYSSCLTKSPATITHVCMAVRGEGAELPRNRAQKNGLTPTCKVALNRS